MLTSAGDGDILLAKYDPSGQLFWASRYGGSGLDQGTSLDLDLAGNIYLTGSFDLTIPLGPVNLTSNGGEDAFVARLDPTGQVQWAKQVGGTDNDGGQAITTDRLGQVHIGGAVIPPVNLDSFTIPPAPNPGRSAFIWSLKTDGTPAIGAQSITEVQPILDYQKIQLDIQSHQLSLTKGGSVNLSSYLDNTDNHALSLNVNQLALTNGGSVDLSSYLDNTYTQTLSLNANQLSLTNGGSVDLSPLQDNLGTHIATQNLQLGPHFISGDGDNEGISISAGGYVGIGNNTPLHPLDFGTGTGRRIALAQNSLGTDFYGFAISANTLEIHAASTQNEDPAMVVKFDGKIGIGTPNPTRGKVEISGGFSQLVTTYGWLNGDGNTGKNTVSVSPNYSLWATDRIAASEFNAFSDARIKDIQGVSGAKTDLATLMQIEITDYRMKDTLAKGTGTTKKVIAQQVAEVYPQAVTTDLTDVIPDIYQRAEVQDGWIMLPTDLQVGERVKVIAESSSEVHEVTAVEADRFQVTGLSFSEPVEENETVFIYGREVNDFHTVD